MRIGIKRRLNGSRVSPMLSSVVAPSNGSSPASPKITGRRPARAFKLKVSVADFARNGPSVSEGEIYFPVWTYSEPPERGSRNQAVDRARINHEINRGFAPGEPVFFY